MTLDPKDILHNPETGKPSKCDLCSDFLLKDVENRLIKAQAMRLAVASGFHVAKKGIARTVITGSPDGPVDQWVKMVENDPHNWTVCPDCWQILKKYMVDAEYGDDVKPVGVVEERQ